MDLMFTYTERISNREQNDLLHNVDHMIIKGITHAYIGPYIDPIKHSYIAGFSCGAKGPFRLIVDHMWIQRIIHIDMRLYGGGIICEYTLM